MGNNEGEEGREREAPQKHIEMWKKKQKISVQLLFSPSPEGESTATLKTGEKGDMTVGKIEKCEGEKRGSRDAA